jgi:hypothetical protein
VLVVPQVQVKQCEASRELIDLPQDRSGSRSDGQLAGIETVVTQCKDQCGTEQFVIVYNNDLVFFGSIHRTFLCRKNPVRHGAESSRSTRS